MAKIGLEYIVAGELDTSVSTSKETAVYKNSREIGPGANFSGTPNSADVKDYGDDRMLETDTSVSGCGLSLELNEPTMENEAWILGHTYDEETNSMVRNTNDVAPYIGIGAVGKSKRNNAVIYRIKVYLKAQFKTPNDENATKQESVTFSHTTMEGNSFQLENGDWKYEAEYTTLEAAKAALNTIFSIEEAAA